jgi:hypothetical protein
MLSSGMQLLLTGKLISGPLEKVALFMEADYVL